MPSSPHSPPSAWRCRASPKTRVFTTPAVLGHRELIIGVTALVTGARAYQAGETVLAMVAFAVILPIVMVSPQARRGVPPRAGSGAAPGRCRPANLWVFLVFLAAARLFPARSMSGVLTPPMPQRSSSRRSGSARPSPPSSSPSLGGASPSRPTCWPCSARSSSSSRLVGTVSGPRDAVTIGVPLTAPVGGHLRGEERARQQPLDAHRPARRHRHRQALPREDLPWRPQPPGELPHLRGAASRRRGRTSHRDRGRPPGPACQREDLA